MNKTEKKTYSIYAEYFPLQQQVEIKYGKKGIVFYQMGMFFEMYEHTHPKKHPETTRLTILSDVFGLKRSADLGDKRCYYDEDGTQCPLYMIGFPISQLEKYIQQFIEHGYSIDVYTQETDNPKSRVFYGFFSATTYVPEQTNTVMKDTHLVTIWLHFSTSLTNRTNRTCTIGIAISHLLSGKSWLSEYTFSFVKLTVTNFDELERYFSIYSVSELLVICTGNTELEYNFITKYIVSILQIENIHFYTDDIKVKNAEKQLYIETILDSQFGANTFSLNQTFGTTFYNTMVATQAFCFLLDYVKERVPELVKRIQLPTFHGDKKMILANHTLIQLSILQEVHNDNTTTSVLQWLNKCHTPMGKRLFKERIVHPTYDEIWLQEQYRCISYFLDEENAYYVPAVRKLLQPIKCIDVYIRQIVMRKCSIMSMYRLYVACNQCQQLTELLYDVPLKYDITGIQIIANIIIQRIESVLHIPIVEKLSGDQMLYGFTYFVSNFEEDGDPLQSSIFLNPLITSEIELAYKNYKDTCVKIYEFYNRIKELDTSGSSAKSACKLCISMGANTESITIQLNKTTGKNVIAKKKSSKDPYIKNISLQSNDTIDSDFFNDLVKTYFSLRKELQKLQRDYYLSFLDELTEKIDELQKICLYITEMDVLFCNVFNASKYKYTCPIIETESKESYVNAKGIRHVLIEQLLTNELYVPNDIDLRMVKGILLYGTNAIGKSSLLKSLGICVIMAQAGMFVPCSSFTYRPYTAIYSRILSQDNLHKHQSKFEYEMVELNVILRMANERSLVLGDELCSGTESSSALGIVVSTLELMVQRGSTFIFATHFHELMEMEEVQQLVQSEKISVKHMAVEYDASTDMLIYHRVLRDGSGATMYGLEVCKSLYLPIPFLDRAYTLRTKYEKKEQGWLSLTTSTYSSKKLRGICEKCHVAFGTEMHHLVSQKDASNNPDLIVDVHSSGNLISLCTKCHDIEHATKNAVTEVKVKTTRGYCRKKKT